MAATLFIPEYPDHWVSKDTGLGSRALPNLCILIEAEQEMQELRERESELESSERHFVQQEEDLRQQATLA